MVAAQMGMSGMWLQDVGSISSGNSRLLMIFVGMVAVAMLAQAIALIAMAIGAAKARKRALAIVDEIQAKALPAIESTQDFVRNYAPRMMTLAENLVETSNIVRNKAVEFDATLSDVNSRARAQTARVDDIVTTVLKGTAEVVHTVQHGVRVPLREFNGLINGLKAGVDVLVGRTRTSGNGRVSRSYSDSNDIDL
jgi:hypothetical protein